MFQRRKPNRAEGADLFAREHVHLAGIGQDHVLKQ
jgi:hypothetical protein